MKDLLTKNIDDRIKDYLTKMDGLSIDEIVKGGTFLSPRKPQQEEPTFGTQKQMQIIDNTRS